MITLTPEAPQPESKFTSPETAQPDVVDPKVIADRVNKAEYGLDKFPEISKENLTQTFALGFEDQIRDQALVSVDIQERKKRLGMVQDIAQQAASEGRSI